jgi:uncharacterized membrane protein
MTLDPKTLALILVMAATAAACRFAGFAFMRFVPMTPRVKAALAAMPLAVMLAIILPPALRGGWPEAAGCVATVTAVLLRGNEVVAVIAGMGAVAIARAMGL